jgi:hypothetical protein
MKLKYTEGATQPRERAYQNPGNRFSGYNRFVAGKVAACR